MMLFARSSFRFRASRTLHALAASTLLVASVSCGSDTVTGPENVPGTYFLRTMDGLELPVTVPNPRDHVIVINAVAATLNSNNTYALAGTGSEDGHGSTVVTDAGTYTQSGSTLSFTSTTLGGATYSGTAKNDTVIVTLPGGFVDSDNATFALVFEKASTPP